VVQSSTIRIGGIQDVPNDNPEQVGNREWWDIKKAAAYLGMSVAFLRKAVRLRKVPFARVGSKAIRFRLADLDRWLEANGCGGEVDCGEQARERR
jgi:excisionase family DNA binding protein